MSSQVRANLHGRPLAILKEMCALVDLRDRIARGVAQGKTRRDWSERMRELVYEVAHQTNLGPENFARAADWVVEAIRRERTSQYLAGCGAKTKAA